MPDDKQSAAISTDNGIVVKTEYTIDTMTDCDAVPEKHPDLKTKVRRKRHRLKYNDVHQCDICSKKCSNRYNLEAHMNMHTRESVFNCDICGKLFLWKRYFTWGLVPENNRFLGLFLSGPTRRNGWAQTLY